MLRETPLAHHRGGVPFQARFAIEAYRVWFPQAEVNRRLRPFWNPRERWTRALRHDLTGAEQVHLPNPGLGLGQVVMWRRKATMPRPDEDGTKQAGLPAGPRRPQHQSRMFGLGPFVPLDPGSAVLAVRPHGGGNHASESPPRRRVFRVERLRRVGAFLGETVSRGSSFGVNKRACAPSTSKAC